jgi:hypothetical protein
MEVSKDCMQSILTSIKGGIADADADAELAESNEVVDGNSVGWRCIQ